MRHAWVLVVVAGCGSSSPGAMPDAASPDTGSSVGEDVATGIVEPGALAVDGTHVYFTHRPSSIARVAKAGGAPQAIAAGQLGPTGLDASTDRLCWVNTGTHSLDFLDGSVRCAPKTGGTDEMLATSFLPNALAIDSDTVFWAEIDGKQVRRIAIGGTDAETLDATLTSKVGIALSPTHLAWTASGDMADVVVMDRATGDKTPISTSEYAPGAIVLAGDDVYWVVRHSLSDHGAVRVSRGFGAPTDLVAEEYWPSQLVRAGDTLYWTSGDRIRSVAMTGGAPVTVATSRGPIGGLATDGDYLYWSERDHGAIVRMPVAR